MRARAFALIAAFAACGVTPPVPPTPPPLQRMPWPHEESDLLPDPALHFARLDNGLRVAWRAAARPAGHCSLRLVVHVGSREEDDGELGMAHFVEHMAFNGTRRFPGTSIV